MKGLYVVRDVKANDVGDQIMVAKADAVAIRAFSDALSNSQSFMSRHPQDYELVFIGEMAEAGDLIAYQPRVVLTGSAWQAAKASEDGAK